MASSLNFTLYSSKRLFSFGRNDLTKLSKLCREFVGTHYSIDIVQVEQEPRRAFLEGVITTPSIMVQAPGERRMCIGGFTATEEYLKSHWAQEQAKVNGATTAQAGAEVITL